MLELSSNSLDKTKAGQISVTRKALLDEYRLVKRNIEEARWQQQLIGKDT